MWCRLAQALAKAKGIGVGALQAAIRRHDDRIYGADPASQRIDAIDHSESCLLVRYGQIAPSKAQNR